MTMRTALGGAALLAVLPMATAIAQDVPGIEICTAEKTWERRTGCLQSNIDYLKSALTKAGLEAERRRMAAEQRLAAAERDIAALKAEIAGLRDGLARLQAAAGKAAQEKDKDKAKEPAAK
jgi:septal ring factor EnvC (AmiA/AmiB activator)